MKRLLFINLFFLSSSLFAQLSTNEIMITHYSPRYSAAGDEYIVLFNNTDASLDLNGYEIAYASSTGSTSIRKTFTSSTIVQSRKYYLLSSNSSVTVGSVTNQISDATYTAFAADAGQITFRKSSDQTVIYALATGVITSYAFGLSTSHTTTTSTSSQGAFELSVSGNSYTRSGDNNADYTLVASSSISSVPNSGTSALPVELTSFTGKFVDGKVELNWETATEVNNYGFNVEQLAVSDKSLAKSQQLNANGWLTLGFVHGHGNSNSPKKYSFTDATPPTGKVMYRLKQIDFDGSYEYSPEVVVEIASPAKLVLAQNFPNPFNPETVISYQLPVASYVTLKVYDVLGNEVAILVNELQPAGFYNFQLSTNNYQLSSGIYFYELKAGNSKEIKKMMILK